MAPTLNAAILRDIGRDLDRHRRTKGRSCELVGPRPAQAHGATRHGASQQAGVERSVVGAVMAIAAGAFRMAHDDPIDWQAEDEGEIGAQVESPLRVTDDP